MIRKATIVDQDQINQLRQKTIKKINLDDYNLLEQEAILQYFQNNNFCKTLEAEIGYVISFENKILGYGSYHAQQNQITDLEVDPEYQGWYFGKKLLKQLELEAQTNGFLDITVDAFLPAVAFFQKHHYIAVKKNVHIYSQQEILTYFMKKYF
ncbi:GNAT family N-acetyltransferase [Spiroplasma citri]|uniref:GNAT family N-acetyltransferase n=1 Tax=Spiroplasma citri TaxID=2133 RepID=A0AAX3SW10_SPICI|nr:GNAT family N-acetyltransferase [Spiroplasma citri]WFG95491.1 GNAT family N-acetyltransferase [Spiroplasma citri]WFG99379.1 GNAT family N-acetyltransferase [Spiroplasma citri]